MGLTIVKTVTTKLQDVNCSYALELQVKPMFFVVREEILTGDNMRTASKGPGVINWNVNRQRCMHHKKTA